MADEYTTGTGSSVQTQRSQSLARDAATEETSAKVGQACHVFGISGDELRDDRVHGRVLLLGADRGRNVAVRLAV